MEASYFAADDEDIIGRYFRQTGGQVSDMLITADLIIPSRFLNALFTKQDTVHVFLLNGINS